MIVKSIPVSGAIGIIVDHVVLDVHFKSDMLFQIQIMSQLQITLPITAVDISSVIEVCIQKGVIDCHFISFHCLM